MVLKFSIKIRSVLIEFVCKDADSDDKFGWKKLINSRLVHHIVQNFSPSPCLLPKLGAGASHAIKYNFINRHQAQDVYTLKRVFPF